jgi:hypothetical protein
LLEKEPINISELYLYGIIYHIIVGGKLVNKFESDYNNNRGNS